MKKVFLVGILTILCVSATFAQFRIGATAGLNVSNFTGDVENNKFKAGFQAGVVGDYAITESFSIMPELLFSQRGSKEKEDGTTYSMTLNYLQLPINAAYKFDAGMGSKLFVFAGPYLGYGLSGKQSFKGKEDGVDVSASFDIEFGSKEDQLKAFDFGLNLGVGYEYQKMFIKLQYNHGLTNLSNYDEGSFKNQNIAVSVGYFFN